jgi:hypothetical protein
LFDLQVSHELVVEELGVVSGSVSEAQHGIQTDAAETTGGPHAVALHHVVSDLEDFLGGQLGTEQRRAGALGEVLPTNRTAETADVSGFAGPTVRAKVVTAPLAIVRTTGVGTGEGRPILLVHDALRSGLPYPNSLANQKFERKADSVTTQYRGLSSFVFFFCFLLFFCFFFCFFAKRCLLIFYIKGASDVKLRNGLLVAKTIKSNFNFRERRIRFCNVLKHHEANSQLETYPGYGLLHHSRLFTKPILKLGVILRQRSVLAADFVFYCHFSWAEPPDQA